MNFTNKPIADFWDMLGDDWEAFTKDMENNPYNEKMPTDSELEAMEKDYNR